MDSPPEGMSKMQLIAWKKKVARGGVPLSPPGSPQPREIPALGCPQQQEPQPPAGVAEPAAAALRKQTQVSAPTQELDPIGKGAEPEGLDPPPEGMSKMQLVAWKKKVARGGVPPSPPGSPRATGSPLPERSQQQKPEPEPEQPTAAAADMQKPTVEPTPNGSGLASVNSEQQKVAREGVSPSPTPGSLQQQQPPSAAPGPPGAALGPPGTVPGRPVATPGQSATHESMLELETSTPVCAVVDHVDGRQSHQALEDGFALASHSDPRESRNVVPTPASLMQRTAELENIPAMKLKATAVRVGVPTDAGQPARTTEETIKVVLAKDRLNERSISQQAPVPELEPAPAAMELAPATPPKRTEVSGRSTPEDKRQTEHLAQSQMQTEQRNDLSEDVCSQQVPKVAVALPATSPRAGYRRGYMMAHTDTSPSSRHMFSLSPAWSPRLSPAVAPQLPASRTPPAMLLAPHRTTRPKLCMQEYDMILAEARRSVHSQAELIRTVREHGQRSVMADLELRRALSVSPRQRAVVVGTDLRRTLSASPPLHTTRNSFGDGRSFSLKLSSGGSTSTSMTVPVRRPASTVVFGRQRSVVTSPRATASPVRGLR